LEIPRNFTSPLLDTGKPTLSLDKLQTGQSTYAKIVDQLPNKTDIILRIGKQTIQAKTEIPVTVGEIVKVTVEKTASELILKIKPPAQQTNVIDSSLRQLIPKQTSVDAFQQTLKQVFTNINQLTFTSQQTQPQDLASQSAKLKRLAINILHTLPDRQKLTSSEGFKSALQNSGVFLEPKLRQALLANISTLEAHNHGIKKLPLGGQNHLLTNSQSPIAFTQVDLKSNLIKLIQLLKSWPKMPPSTSQQASANPLLIPSKSPVTVAQATNPALVLENQIKELMSKTEGAVAKITLNQLASSNTEQTGNRQAWQIEIPFLSNQSSESVFLQIEREDASNTQHKEAEQKWTISLEMNPPKLGLIKNKLSLNKQHVNADFWAENPETRGLIQQHLDLFKKQLIRANLQPEHIQANNGTGPIIQKLQPSTAILSEKA